MGWSVDLASSIQTRWSLSPTFVIFLTILVDLTGFGMIIPLLPFYAETFQAGPTALGFLVASFSVMQFIFSPMLGRLSDNVGRKPVLLLSILISSASFLLFALASSFFMLLLSRVIAGMATESAVAQAYIADITSKRERAVGIGRVGAAHGIGFIIGPAIGGFLSVYGFWAPGFAAFALTLVNLLFVYFFLPKSIVHKNPSKEIESRNDTGYLNRLANALTRPLIGSVLAIFFIIALAFSTIPVVAPLLGKAFFNFEELEMSYVFVYIGLIQIVLQGFLIGRFAKKFGEEKLIVFGPLLITLGMFLMPLIQNVAIFFVSITLIASGIGTMNTAVPSFISKRTSANEQGGTLGVTQSMASIARVPGPLIGGLVFEFAGLAAPFLLSATLLMVAFVLGCRVFRACGR
ncbi:MAG: MFS transporter [Candidatus Bathyarchaeota archaeon]|nr:MFS transporter [Candidatus Bathyarchaeota archaeon]